MARREGEDRWLRGTVRVVKDEKAYVEFEDGVFDLATELRRPDDEPRLALEEAPPAQYVMGDRVLGRWLDLWWYPGTILSHEQGRYQVQFDDGDRGALLDRQLLPLQLEVGEAVQCRPKGQMQLAYKAGSVTHVAGEIFDIEYEDGDVEQNTHISRVRLWRCPVSPAEFPFHEGDRVLVNAAEGYWYPADILSIESDRIVVHYLLGGEGMVTPELVKSLEVKPGLRVEGRWRGGNAFFLGRIAQQRGERLFLKYDDGDEEWTTIRLIRLVDDVPPPVSTTPSGSWKAGDRVLACWSGNGLWYVGVIRGVQDGRYHVVFEDGDQAHVSADQIAAVDFPVGSKVMAPRPGQPSYVPAQVRRFDGMRVLLRYDDGMEVMVDVRHVCVQRG